MASQQFANKRFCDTRIHNLFGILWYEESVSRAVCGSTK